jgi:activator of HSP90 ATPase
MNMEGLAMSIHQQATIPADPGRVYQVLADARALSALSGMGGRAALAAGEEFAAFDGNVTGRQIEMVPGTRIVQAWRFPRWEPGQYSLVTFTLTATDGGTRLTIDQHGEPDDWHDHIDANWPTFYLTPPAGHFAPA